MCYILAINPGSTSTKVGLYQGEEELFSETTEHFLNEGELTLEQQLSFRLQGIESFMKSHPPKTLRAVVGRGGLLYPLKAGTYLVTERVLLDLKRGVMGDHPSNLGGILAHRIGERYGVPSYIVDPVTVDELIPEARISGHPAIERKSLSHALNMKAVSRRIAGEEGKRYEDVNIITVHLGGGISIAPHHRGEMIDVNNANEQGPFSVERAGGLPSLQLVDYSFKRFEEGISASAIKEELTKKSGLFGYLGTKDFREALKGKENSLILKGMVHQIGKEIGGAATVLQGEVDFIILTGGMAHSPWLIEEIRKRVSFIAPLRVVPGENELRALALGALRVLRGEEEVQEYRGDQGV